MDTPDLSHYKAVNSIVERDSTFATYKYALLRGVIEICRDLPHQIKEEENRVFLPLGRLIEKWLIYYYPIFSSERFIPQQGGEKKGKDPNKFRRAFATLIDFYRDKGGYSQWYSDYRRGKIPAQIQDDFIQLCKKIRSTITTMPMYHLGYSQNGTPYSILDYSRKRQIIPKKGNPDREFLITHFGEFFFVKREIYDVFSLFGGYLTGETTILRKWAEMTHRLDAAIGIGDMISLLTVYPVEERDVLAGQNFCNHLGNKKILLTCVWSGQPITEKQLHLDHMLPFSICKNNDLWNLMPALKQVNEQKSDFIPSLSILETQKQAITGYWTLMSEFDPESFFRDIRISLMGSGAMDEHWQDHAFDCLKERCRFMINMLGYEEWNGP